MRSWGETDEEDVVNSDENCIHGDNGAMDASMQEQDDFDSTERCFYNLLSLVRSIIAHIHVYVHYCIIDDDENWKQRETVLYF